MESYAAGWLSILPPIVAIVLALVTKEVLSSLLIGILTGTLIYSIGTDANVVMGTLQTAFSTMGAKVDFNILIFTSLLGALVYVVAMSGGTKAYGKWAVSKIKGRRSSLLATSGLGILIFIDDYFNCLTVGTVMRPVCDNYRVSRAKLAYIIDSTAAPVCIIAPVSSWAAAVGSSLKDNSVFESDMAAFIATIPWNFYALLSILMIFFIALTNFDFGPMAKSEERALSGAAEEGGVAGHAEPPKANPRGKLFDMLVPILSLIVFAVLALMYTGGYLLGRRSEVPHLPGRARQLLGFAFARLGLVRRARRRLRHVRSARSRAVLGLHGGARRRDEAHASGEHHSGSRLDAFGRVPRSSADAALRAVARDLGRRRLLGLPPGRDLPHRRLPLLLDGDGLGYLRDSDSDRRARRGGDRSDAHDRGSLGDSCGFGLR